MSGRLITDEDVLAGRVCSPLVLGPDDLLTPAARDRAVVKGFVIVERDGSSSGCGQAPVAAAPSAAGGGCGAGPADGGDAGGCDAVARPCGCGCKGDCDCQANDAHSLQAAAAALADGLYLVRVCDGKLAWVRPVAGETPALPSRKR